MLDVTGNGGIIDPYQATTNRSKKMRVEVSPRLYPTITTLRELYKGVFGTIVPSYSEDYESKSLRARRVIKFIDAKQPEWMTIREACRRIVAAGEKLHKEKIEVVGVDL